MINEDVEANFPVKDKNILEKFIKRENRTTNKKN